MHQYSICLLCMEKLILLLTKTCYVSALYVRFMSVNELSCAWLLKYMACKLRIKYFFAVMILFCFFLLIIYINCFFPITTHWKTFSLLFFEALRMQFTLFHVSIKSFFQIGYNIDRYNDV